MPWNVHSRQIHLRNILRLKNSCFIDKSFCESNLSPSLYLLDDKTAEKASQQSKLLFYYLWEKILINDGEIAKWSHHSLFYIWWLDGATSTLTSLHFPLSLPHVELESIYVHDSRLHARHRISDASWIAKSIEAKKITRVFLFCFFVFRLPSPDVVLFFVLPRHRNGT